MTVSCGYCLANGQAALDGISTCEPINGYLALRAAYDRSLSRDADELFVDKRENRSWGSSTVKTHGDREASDFGLHASHLEGGEGRREWRRQKNKS